MPNLYLQDHALLFADAGEDEPVRLRRHRSLRSMPGNPGLETNKRIFIDVDTFDATHAQTIPGRLAYRTLRYEMNMLERCIKAPGLDDNASLFSTSPRTVPFTREYGL